jgi:uncharacterized membrane protein
MVSGQVIILGSFLLAFKAVLLEGSEVAILSLATVRQIGRRNVLAGIILGLAASAFIFLGVRQVFLLLPSVVIDFVTGTVILYFSSKFLRGFIGYYFQRKSFALKMKNLESEVLAKERLPQDGEMRFSLLNSLPVFSITLTEGFEASLVLAAAGSFNLEWTLLGAGFSIMLIILISSISYNYLVNFPRWLLDLIAGLVLLSFGTLFIVTGVFEFLG